jgi:hypothetical protein
MCGLPDQQRKMEESIVELMNELNEIELKRTEKLQQIEAKIKSFPVDPDLIYFYGESCPFTARAQPEIQCLEIKLGKQLTKKEVWNSVENQQLYQTVGGQKNCGGVPYFYNKATGNSVCGARACDLLFNWAKSDPNARAAS